ncbi:F0F1 ATP synthase subunit delta [Paracoccus aestuarii]|uniref:ATP synthase subunit delta n=1 Tax=Paracoccus aestuarii TaxID=453842 RepID=A0A418ZXR7_9RHOB|nr:F0F1 ATP synthase subunit delta [Paracoccus aestuarii]RJL05319.1 F0F1 ATP synthase subunit delta [Paracoccus aestuarii]WCR00429.1 F0F1 ATP synthase subunit delta [Paracoccus aestuarii]
MTVANSVSMSQSIAGRYAQAVFEIAKESGGLDDLARQTADLDAALTESDALRELISSPKYSRDDQARAIAAVSDRMGLSPVLGNTLRLMASNRRLFVLPQLIRALQDRIAQERGEVTAEVTSAVALSDDQQNRLKQTLAEKSGKTVKLNTRVDETLIGGMIVKLGSQMIDSSVRSKLASLQNVMKEVG